MAVAMVVHMADFLNAILLPRNLVRKEFTNTQYTGFFSFF